MAKKKKIIHPKARLPKGMRDVTGDEVRAVNAMLDTIRAVFERYGFEPLETPAFEYSDALGKFLPDQDRPNEGVFSFQDDDGQWVSLRYDLTAPLARYVAENYDALPKPFRRYQTGPIWRNEKPGPGRFRQFTQFDADTVGTANVVADAEICLLFAETLERLGIDQGDFVVRVNNRKVLDGVLETIGLAPQDQAIDATRGTILRAIDKLDRLGIAGVALLLGAGRRDESGDFTKGAGLTSTQIEPVLDFVQAIGSDRATTVKTLADLVRDSDIGQEGVSELARMDALMTAAGASSSLIAIDPGVVRGLGYYTGPVMEAELTFEAETDEGGPARFGSVGGGGRYDGLVARFKGAVVPATGFSVGVSRLYTALHALGKIDSQKVSAPVVVLVMDFDRTDSSQALTQELRAGGIRAEMYLGTSGMKAQMKYADRRGAPCVIIEGDDERARGEVTIKDLLEGARMSREIESREEWREGRPAQISVPRSDMVATVRRLLGQ